MKQYSEDRKQGFDTGIEKIIEEHLVYWDIVLTVRYEILLTIGRHLGCMILRMIATLSGLLQWPSNGPFFQVRNFWSHHVRTGGFHDKG